MTRNWNVYFGFSGDPYGRTTVEWLHFKAGLSTKSADEFLYHMHHTGPSTTIELTDGTFNLASYSWDKYQMAYVADYPFHYIDEYA